LVFKSSFILPILISSPKQLLELIIIITGWLVEHQCIIIEYLRWFLVLRKGEEQQPSLLTLDAGALLVNSGGSRCQLWLLLAFILREAAAVVCAVPGSW